MGITIKKRAAWIMGSYTSAICINKPLLKKWCKVNSNWIKLTHNIIWTVKTTRVFLRWGVRPSTDGL